MALGFFGFNRNKYPSGIPSGTYLIQNGVIVDPALCSGSLKTSGYCSGAQSGYDSNVYFTITDKLVGKELIAVFRGRRTNKCYNGENSWYSQLFDGNAVLASVNILSTTTYRDVTVQFTCTDPQFRVRTVLSRNANSSQGTQTDGSEAEIISLQVV